MKHSRISRGTLIRRLTVAVSASLLFGLLLVVVQVGRAAGGAALNVRISSPRTQVLPCEPFVLEVSIRNAGAQPVEIRYGRHGGLWGQHDTARHRASILITDPDGRKWRYRGPIELHGGINTVEVAPGQRYTYRQVLVIGEMRDASPSAPPAAPLRQWPFWYPGEFTLEYSYSLRADAGPEFKAEPLTVQVMQPEGHALDALQFLKERQNDLLAGIERRRSNGTDAQEAGQWLQEWVERELGVAAERYADTPYGPYAKFYLAYHLAFPLSGPERREKAIVLFRELLDESPSFPLADQCMLYLARCYLHTNKKDEALEVLEKLLADFPRSPVTQQAQEEFKELLKPPREPQPGPSESPPTPPTTAT